MMVLTTLKIEERDLVSKTVKTLLIGFSTIGLIIIGLTMVYIFFGFNALMLMLLLPFIIFSLLLLAWVIGDFIQKFILPTIKN